MRQNGHLDSGEFFIKLACKSKLAAWLLCEAAQRSQVTNHTRGQTASGCRVQRGEENHGKAKSY